MSDLCPDCGQPMPCCHRKSRLPPFVALSIAELESDRLSMLGKIVALRIRRSTHLRNVNRKPTYREREMSLREICEGIGFTDLDAAREAIAEAALAGWILATASGADCWIVCGIAPMSKIPAAPGACASSEAGSSGVEAISIARAGDALVPKTGRLSTGEDPDQGDLCQDQEYDSLSRKRDGYLQGVQVRDIIAVRLRAAIQSAGMTHDELARESGIARSGIAQVLAGERSPKVDVLGKLARALGVSLAALVDGA